jgi:hypothetical protein
MKKNAKKIAGGLLLAAPFVTLATIFTAEHGLQATAIVFGITAVVVLVIVAGVYLITDDESA